MEQKAMAKFRKKPVVIEAFRMGIDVFHKISV